MKIIYSSQDTERQCTDLKVGKKFFGGDESLALNLQSRRQALEDAETLQDIVVQKTFRFHKLHKKGKKNLEGLFAIDVKSKANPWRLIIQPLDENEKPFVPCNIDEIAKVVRVVEIVEVSKHYE